MRILVIEYNRDILANVLDYLELKGYVVDCAQDGLSGLHLAATQDYDLIVLDLMLPGEDGLSLARRLRSDSRVPIIMISARGEDVDRIVGREVGADDYRAKPFNPRELLPRIRAVLRLAGAEGDGLGGIDLVWRTTGRTGRHTPYDSHCGHSLNDVVPD